ncbi:MAG: sodium-dependent transporter [Flammeovirgaceae bacterium]|nr:sodium-dependent transporter [Flammeovirgaceae bacterium]
MAIRSGFSSRLGFVAAAAGSAVGLGNIWKFPFEVGAGGGGVFLIMYLAFCFLLCFPVMVAEIAIGRKTQRNPVGAFKVLGFPKWSIIGKLGLVSGVLILSFYNVVAGWAFGYFLEMIMGNFTIGEHFGEYIKDVVKVGAYGLIFMGTTAYIVSKGISGGIEKAAKLLMPTLVIIMLSLVAYSLTLDNAWEGIKFYLVPDISEVRLEVVYKALGQAFFSLSLGMGALITYGSYVGKNENIITSAVLITFADVGIAFIAGLMMFPLVFSQGLPPNGGPGLIFVTLPGVFGSLGGGLGIFIGSLFFLLLSFAALTSTVSLLEVPVSYVVDELDIRRTKAVWLVALIIFVVGLPSLIGNGYSAMFTNFITYLGDEKTTNFMDFVGHVANDTFLPLGGFLISMFAAYIWKKPKFYGEISKGYPGFENSIWSKYLGFGVRYLCPTILGLLFILTVLDRFFGITVIA